MAFTFAGQPSTQQMVVEQPLQTVAAAPLGYQLGTQVGYYGSN